MNKISAECFLLLSSGASVVFGSSIRGTGLEMKQDEQVKARNLANLFGGGERGGNPSENLSDEGLDIKLGEEEEDLLEGDEYEANEWEDEEEEAAEGPDGADPSSIRLRGYSYNGGNHIGSSYHGGSSYHNGNSHHGGNSYHKHWNKGCRTFNGGKGSSYNDYDLYDYVDKKFCKGKCDSLGDYCHGYEYSKSGGCEVWKSPIFDVGYAYGRDCYKKH